MQSCYYYIYWGQIRKCDILSYIYYVCEENFINVVENKVFFFFYLSYMKCDYLICLKKFKID